MNIDKLMKFLEPHYKWVFVLNQNYKMTAQRKLFNTNRNTEVKLSCKGSTFGYYLLINGTQKFISITQFNKQIKVINNGKTKI